MTTDGHPTICGNNPNTQLLPGDIAAIEEFQQILADRKQAERDTEQLAAEILAERHRQLAKFGDQRHPDGTSGHNFKREADAARRSCQRAARNETVTWFHILREEFWEAMAETDQTKLRAELVQCAAVIAAWISDIDRRPAG